MHYKTLSSRAFAAGVVSLLCSMAHANSSVTDVDPAELAFAIAVPDAFQLAAGDANFTVEYRTNAASLEESFDLTLAQTTLINGQNSPDRPVYVGRLSTSDQQRLREMQSAIAQAESAGQHGDGSASLSVTGGCFTGAAPTEIPISTWIRTDLDEGYMEVIREQDLLSMLDGPTRKQLIDNLRICD